MLIAYGPVAEKKKKNIIASTSGLGYNHDEINIKYLLLSVDYEWDKHRTQTRDTEWNVNVNEYISEHWSKNNIVLEVLNKKKKKNAGWGWNITQSTPHSLNTPLPLTNI